MDVEWIHPEQTKGTRSAQHGGSSQFVVSSFTLDLVELRSFFLGGGAGDDPQSSEPGSLKFFLGRFRPTRFDPMDWLPVGVGEGDAEALKVGETSGFREGGRYISKESRTRGLHTCVSEFGILVQVVHGPPSC
jgi:hypothetical protein